MLEVDGRRSLAGIDRDEVVGQAQTGAILAPSDGVASAGRFHLDHVRTQQGQLMRGERAGEHVGQIDDAHAFQGSAHDVS